MEYSKDNIMTRKEYLKSKKKHKFLFSKLKYVLLFIVIVLLGVYVYKQLKTYNNVTQMANKVLEEAKLAKTMTMYYVSETYTKDGNSTVMLYKSSDESRTNIKGTDAMRNIHISSDKLYGVLEDGLYVIDLLTLASERLVENKVNNYVVNNKEIFLSMDDGIYRYNIESKELKQIIENKAEQLLINNNHIYVITKGKTSRSIIRYDLNGKNKKELSDKYIVSSMYISDEHIFFINLKEEKLYMMTKSGENIKKITDNKVRGNNVLEYKGNIYYINSSDSNTLYHINLSSNVEEMAVKKNIDSIQIDGNIIYFKSDIGIYKYNIETGKYEQITSVRALEYVCKN